MKADIFEPKDDRERKLSRDLPLPPLTTPSPARRPRTQQAALVDISGKVQVKHSEDVKVTQGDKKVIMKGPPGKQKTAAAARRSKCEGEGPWQCDG